MIKEQIFKPLVKLPSPIIEVPFLDEQNSGLNFFMKREDLIHPFFGGNKWRKLKYNLIEYKSGNHDHLITFGGPFSNHIAATSSICQAHKISCTGIIRGTYIDDHNPTLKKAKSEGMELIFVPKEIYSQKVASSFFSEFLSQYQKPYVIPEGGSNDLALKGIAEMMQEINGDENHYDHIMVAAGTGTTALGVINQLHDQKLTIINVLKNKGLEKQLKERAQENNSNWVLNNDFHFGGFAKVTKPLINFCNQFYSKTKIKLDPVYNGKLVYAANALVEAGYFKSGSKILLIHTGGMQGITAYNYVSKNNEMKLFESFTF